MRVLRFIGKLHLIWVLIVLLLAFFVFVSYVADVGGSHEGIPLPPHHTPHATPN